MIEEMTIQDWFCRMENGQILCGKTIGSFANIKGLKMKELWVTYLGRKYSAPLMGAITPLGFDFYVSMTLEPKGIQAKAYKLIALYSDCKLTRMVFLDGRTEIRQELQKRLKDF